MTRMRIIKRTCAVCGKTSSHQIITSTSSWGDCDLDLRPAPMYRYTMNVWLERCPHCGYVAGNIGRETEISRDFLESDEYLNCDGFKFKSDLSKKFYRHYLISKAIGNYSAEYSDLKHCAWACDDACDELAVEMRKMALATRALEECIDEGNEYCLIVKADLLRRSLQFDKLIEEFSDVTFEDPDLNKVIKFQLVLAKKKDSARYRECHALKGGGMYIPFRR